MSRGRWAVADESDEDKTESPSPRRLEKAREEGQVPQSRELSTFVVLMAGGAALWALSQTMGRQMAQIVREGLHFDVAIARDAERVLSKTGGHGLDGLLLLAPFIGFIALAALGAPMLLRGWLFSGKALLPKFERINPASGLKRMFSTQGLVELVKSILKVTLLGWVAVVLIMANLDALLGLSAETPDNATRHMGDIIGRIVLTLAGTMLLVVALDVPYQLWNYYKKLRMTKEEVRREAKESEGDPHVKARIRAQQREAARRRMMAEIPSADVVVTNPTHYAVALKYGDDMRAPKVVARGADVLAAKIREVAAEHRVPILEAPPLARALYRHADLGDEIPTTLYGAVAEVLAWVYQLKRYQSEGGEAPERPRKLPVPPDLDPGPAPDAPA